MRLLRFGCFGTLHQINGSDLSLPLQLTVRVLVLLMFLKFRQVSFLESLDKLAPQTTAFFH